MTRARAAGNLVAMAREHKGRLRAAAAALIMPLGTLAVHQLRYLLVFGHHAGRMLTAQGDGYAASLVPWLAVLGALGLVGTGVASLARRSAGSDRTGLWPRRRFAALWVTVTAFLVLGYCGQEGLEVLVGDAHQSLLPLAFGAGGWVALPLSAAIGLVWALVLRGARQIVVLVGRRRRRSCAPRRRKAPTAGAGRESFRPSASPLARRLAGRAPPLAGSVS